MEQVMEAARKQVVVITGSSAGVGRATAQAFARRGWRVALLARDAAALEATRAELEAIGAEACAEPVDVADAGAVVAAAERIVHRWQAIDLWINAAMATIFAPLELISPDEYARVTAVTYLGAVHGTMAALKHMLPRDAGRIVQIGSALSYRAIPLQSAYCGAKFGVRGFTDAVRCELLHAKSGVRLTMVQLPAVDTPQFEWARSRLPRRLQPVPPIHAPEAIAQAIVRASERMPREAWVGVPTLQAIVGQLLAPGWLDRLMVRKAWDGQMTDEPETGHADALFAPVTDLHRVHGRFVERERTSVRSFDAAHVRIALALLAIALLGAAWLAGAVPD